MEISESEFSDGRWEGYTLDAYILIIRTYYVVGSVGWTNKSDIIILNKDLVTKLKPKQCRAI